MVWQEEGKRTAGFSRPEESKKIQNFDDKWICSARSSDIATYGLFSISEIACHTNTMFEIVLQHLLNPISEFRYASEQNRMQQPHVSEHLESCL